MCEFDSTAAAATVAARCDAIMAIITITTTTRRLRVHAHTPVMTRNSKHADTIIIIIIL